MELEGRVALVTGGSRGLGKAITEELLRGGAHVMVMARDRPALDNAMVEFQSSKPRPDQLVVAASGDVSSADDVARVVAQTSQELGRLDVLVCNAGVYGPLGRIEDVSWDAWADTIAINLFGVVHCCRAALPVMRQQRYGKIIALSGGGATAPLPRISAYAASKAAVVRFIETLALEVADDGIDVNSIAPGALNTRLLDQVIDAGPDVVGTDYFGRMVREKERGGTPLETGAELVRFLASAASDGITGRLISAVWDDWRHMPDIRDRIATSDVYTLRRIVPEDRGWSEE